MRFTFALLVLYFSSAAVVCQENPPDYRVDFPYEGLSFDSQFSWDVCARRTIRVIPPGKSNKYDYSVVINELLQGVEGKGGGTVELPNGVYHLRTPIQMRNRTCLKGMHQRKTVLRAHESLSNAILVENAGRVTISRLTINAMSRSDSGVNVLRSRYVLLAGITVRRTRINSVYIQESFHTAVDSVILRRSTQNCIHLRRTLYAAIVGSNGKLCGNNGIIARGARRLSVADVFLSNGIGCGLAVSHDGRMSSSRVHITRSSLDNFRRSGICASRTNGLVMDYNHLTSNLYPLADCVDIKNGVLHSTMVRNSCDGDGVDTTPLSQSEILNLEQSTITFTEEPCRPQFMSHGVCCAEDCKICGERGCGLNGQAHRCCVGAIHSLRKKCGQHKPPCVI